MIYDYRDSQSDILILPNDYRVFGSLGEDHFISKKQEYSPIIVGSNVIEIGWKDHYVLYKRNIYSKNIFEIGVLNTKNDTITILSSEKDIDKQLQELKIKAISLNNVEELIENKRKR